MSKELQVTVYVDEAVSSIASARNYAERAERCRKEAKRKLWGLVIATPKDIVSDGEDPMEVLQERFDDIWDTLWDSFIDDYIYSMIADDAEFNETSLVKKQWENEEKERQKMLEEHNKCKQFWKMHEGVLSPYNFDDYKIYNEWRDGNIVITEPLTKEQRNAILEDIKSKEKKVLEEVIKKAKSNGK